MRQLAVTYQQLVGEGADISICMAGLPYAISTVLNDDILTFLNRANKVEIGAISLNSVRDYYASALEKMGVKAEEVMVNAAADATGGFPYLMQLIGYYILKYTDGRVELSEDIVNKAIKSAKSDLVDNVFKPILRPLSDGDLAVLTAMAREIHDGIVKTSQIAQRMGKDNSYIQPYRARLIESGVIESPRRSELVFAVPYLAEYLAEEYRDEY